MAGIVGNGYQTISGTEGTVKSVNEIFPDDNGNVEIDIPILPENIVNTVNGQTGDVTINIPSFKNGYTYVAPVGDLLIEPEYNMHLIDAPASGTVTYTISTSFNRDWNIGDSFYISCNSPNAIVKVSSSGLRFNYPGNGTFGGTVPITLMPLGLYHFMCTSFSESVGWQFELIETSLPSSMATVSKNASTLSGELSNNGCLIIDETVGITDIFYPIATRNTPSGDTRYIPIGTRMNFINPTNQSVFFSLEKADGDTVVPYFVDINRTVFNNTYTIRLLDNKSGSLTRISESAVLFDGGFASFNPE